MDKNDKNKKEEPKDKIIIMNKKDQSTIKII